LILVSTKGPAIPPELSDHQPPAILGKSGRSYHLQETKGARREPARHPQRAIWIPEDQRNSKFEDDRVHHGRVQQESSDRGHAPRRLQGLRQGLAQRTSNQDAGSRLFSRPGKTN